MRAAEIVEEALRLTADERTVIVDRLLESLDTPDPEIDRIWGEEALRRVEALDAGRMKTYPADDVIGAN